MTVKRFDGLVLTKTISSTCDRLIGISDRFIDSEVIFPGVMTKLVRAPLSSRLSRSSTDRQVGFGAFEPVMTTSKTNVP